MERIEIGKWLVTNKGIEYTKNNKFIYEKSNLIESEEQERDFTNSLLEFAEENVLSVNDFDNLVRVLIYAIEYYKFKIDREHFLDTIKSHRN